MSTIAKELQAERRKELQDERDEQRKELQAERRQELQDERAF